MKSDDKENEIDVFELIWKLRQEKLFIKNERNSINELNDLIHSRTQKIIKNSWVTIKQKLLLNQRETCSQTCRTIDAVLKSNFIDAKKVLGFQTSIKVGTLLQILRTEPVQLSKWLLIGEQIVDDHLNYPSVVEIIVNSLYSSCIFPEDKKYMLTLLNELAKLQLLHGEPRRVLKQRTCSFRLFYLLFHEVSQNAKIFLSAALEMPIMQLLAYNDFYLDLDPDKTVMRYKDVQNTFKDAVEYRNKVVEKLAEFTNVFVNSILENVYSFPKSISWIVCQVSKLIEKQFSTKEANAMVTELIFNLYICPAIVDPEQYGICSTNISEIARHNLIQVAQIIQTLALLKYESPELKLADIVNSLDNKNAITGFYEILFFDLENMKTAPLDSSPSITRDLFLFTENELTILVNFLQKVKEQDKLSSLEIQEQLANLNLNLSPTKTNNIEQSTELVLNKSKFFSSKNNHTKHNIEHFKTNLVLILSIDNVCFEPIGVLPEEKVIQIQTENDNLSSNVDEKQSYPNFDEASDNLEVISEAASNHSVASSIELEENEDQNDNLSDMVSANVSGRGTPNISGRDTPSSQVNENEDRILVENRPQDVNNVEPVQAPQISRQIRSEIDDKFCKFEIKKLAEGDETISIISETWSTDVLSSDNEAVDSTDHRTNFQLMDQPILENIPNSVLDISETQSESAWSTDVTASDTDRLTEVDQDEINSDNNSVENVVTTPRRSSSSFGPPQNFVSPQNFVQPQNYNYSNNSIFQELKNTKTIDSNANMIKGIEKKVVTEQNVSYETCSNEMLLSKTTSYSSRVTNKVTTSELTNMAGPSGLNNVKQVNSLQYHTNKTNNEVLLSNTSLNSSSSGSSSNSFENNKMSLNENWENKPYSSGSSLNITLTPSESTSELSIINNQNVHYNNHSFNNTNNVALRKTSTLAQNQVRKSGLPSTGAIPKSISFDVSADKGYDDEARKKTGFLGKFITGIRGRRSSKTSVRTSDEFSNGLDSPFQSGGRKIIESSPIRMTNTEASDILAKYRTKPFAESNGSPSKDGSTCDEAELPPGGGKNGIGRKEDVRNRRQSIGTDRFSEANSFNDIKHKLRLVLSNTPEIPHYIQTSWITTKNKIETILRLELGRARSMRDYSNVARVTETIRCVNALNNDTCLELLKSMKQDITGRTTYIQYLLSSKQELLFCDMYLHSLTENIQHERVQNERYLASVCVREFLEEQENLIASFIEEYIQLTLADEKNDLLNNFFEELYNIMNGSTNWHIVFKTREKLIKSTLERSIMSKVYTNSIYPNGDGDRHRDCVLREHISKLGRLITPSHKDLQIQVAFLRECPWVPAQEALKTLDACTTPRAKVNCVVRCARVIMDLLGMAGANTTADDFTPVLIYVIIKVNPEALLSTVQYVNSFFSNQLAGEEAYWWTQFCSAIEFIKTMDYSD